MHRTPILCIVLIGTDFSAATVEIINIDLYIGYRSYNNNYKSEKNLQPIYIYHNTHTSYIYIYIIQYDVPIYIYIYIIYYNT